MPKTIIISLGGSIIIPEPAKIDIKFLKEFRQIILGFIQTGSRVVIITGGGKINKFYNESAKKITGVSNEGLDWIGISLTKVNAELVRSIFGDKACNKVISNPTEKIKTNKKIIIGCGWLPGCSSDKDAVLIAKNLGAKTIINLTNIDYVYTADPRKDKGAKSIRELTWKQYKKLIGGKWLPRMNTPFDPLASRLAEKLGLEVIIMKGTNLPNFKKFLKGEKFEGTIIHP